jgi:hypothetical protein
MLRGNSRKNLSGGRVPIDIAPEARNALIDLLFEDDMRGVGYSEFIMRAVEAAKFEEGSGVKDGNHALLCGNVLGALMNMAEKTGPVLKTDIEVILDDDGSYTNVVYITRPSGRYMLTIEKVD